MAAGEVLRCPECESADGAACNADTLAFGALALRKAVPDLKLKERVIRRTVWLKFRFVACALVSLEACHARPPVQQSVAEFRASCRSIFDESIRVPRRRGDEEVVRRLLAESIPVKLRTQLAGATFRCPGGADDFEIVAGDCSGPACVVLVSGNAGPGRRSIRPDRKACIDPKMVLDVSEYVIFFEDYFVLPSGHPGPAVRVERPDVLCLSVARAHD